MAAPKQGHMAILYSETSSFKTHVGILVLTTESEEQKILVEAFVKITRLRILAETTFLL